MARKASIVALLLASITWVSAAGAETLNIGSSNPGSLTHSVSSAIAKLITKELKVQTRVQPHGGQSAFIPAVNAGEVDFGIANCFEMVDAVAGKGIYEGQVLGNLRGVGAVMPLMTAFWVAKDSPIKSMKDLKGKRLPGGWTSQKIIGYLASGMLANAGLSYDDVTVVPVPNVNLGADEFIQGKVDAFFFAVGAAKVREAGAKVGGLRAVPLDPSPEAMARFNKLVPVVYALQIEPSDANYGIHEPTYVTAQDYLLLTNKSKSEELIYKVTKTIHGGKKDFLETFKPLGENFSPQEMARKMPAGEFHPGAVKFYKEAGLWPPK